MIVPPGRSSVGRYAGAPALLYGGVLTKDLSGKSAAQPDFLSSYRLNLRRDNLPVLRYDGLLFDALQAPATPVASVLPLNSVRAISSRPIGVSESGNAAHGFVDDAQKRLVFGSLHRDEVLGAALDALGRFGGVPNDPSKVARNAFYSDTRQIFRDAANGRLILNAPQVQALGGNLSGVKGIAGGLGVKNARNGAIVAVSLDGLPLVRSRRYVIKMVTDAKNLDEIVVRDPRFIRSPHGQWMLTQFGKGPVSTSGKAAPPLQIFLAGKPQLSVAMTGGSWELYVDGDSRRFYCDTPGIKWTFGAPPTNGALWKTVSASGFFQQSHSKREKN